jgi:hypothetical protein
MKIIKYNTSTITYKCKKIRGGERGNLSFFFKVLQLVDQMRSVH